MNTITPQQLAASRNGNPLDLVDVRTPAEHRAVHIADARLIPLDRVNADEVKRTRPADSHGPTYVVCKSGGRSKTAIEKLHKQDPALDLVLVEGGTDAAIQQGVPVVRGKQSISLERQVRIAAGFLVALGVAAGFFLSPWWLILPAFVGCGLVFAGITNTCGMAMLLARMPWNR